MTMGMTPMGQMVPSTQFSSVTPAMRRRFGRIAARIGTDHIHRVSIACDVRQKSVMSANDPSETRFDRVLRYPPGMRLQLGIQDITLYPQFAGLAKWFCEHKDCQLLQKSWGSKEQLLADHEDDRILMQKEEAHVYYAAVELPEHPAVEEVRDEKGKITRHAQEYRAPMVMLLSDER